MQSTRVYLADAGSTDGTAEIALGFTKWLDLQVIPGGLPAVGRNAGARRASTPYVLFIDADIEVTDRTLVRRALKLDQHFMSRRICLGPGPLWREQFHAALVARLQAVQHWNVHVV
jgi:glycosyltransferase involved in cell wall biosynthesis